MSFFLNQQNKKHFALYSYQDLVQWNEQTINWADVMFSKRSNLLNKRLSKISPRRGNARQEIIEREIIDFLEGSLHEDSLSIETIEELTDDVT